MNRERRADPGQTPAATPVAARSHNPLPPEHPLVGCFEKLLRAHHHYQGLIAEISSIGAGVTSGELEYLRFNDLLNESPDRPGFWTVRTVVGQVTQPPLSLSTAIGDIVHNLRSSLDNLAFELSFLGTRGQVPGRTVSYPCCFTRTGRYGWNKDGLRRLPGVMTRHREQIYKTQPCYRRRDPPPGGPPSLRADRHWLADLDALWSYDKHRLIEPAFVAAREVLPFYDSFLNCKPVGAPRFNSAFFQGPLKTGTEVMALDLEETGGPDIGVHPHIQVEAQIGFGNGIPVAHALERMAFGVEGVLTRFRTEFETPCAKRLWGLPRGSWIDRVPVQQPTPVEVSWARAHSADEVA